MNLADWLKRTHSPSEQVTVVEGVCDALHQAHTRGALRSEIGPAAIELLGEGQCEVRPGSAPVPPNYRAPESRAGASGPTAAVFAAGVILYEILAGRHPFPGGAGAAPPEPLRNLRRDLPSELTDAVMACLESDPDWRPKDLSYVLQVLRRLRGTPAPPPPTRAASRAPAEVRPRADVPRARAAQQKRGGPPLLAITVGVTALVVAAVAYWLSTAPGRTKTAPPASPRATPLVAASVGPTPAAAPSASAAPSDTPRAVVATPPTPRPATPTPPPATPVPTPTPRPATPTPPPAVAQPTPPPVAAGPVVLKSLAPPAMTRGSTNFYDLHGTGLRPNLTAVMMKGRDVIQGITVTKQVFVGSNLMRIVVRVDPSVAVGSYTLVLVDAQGQATNGVSFKVN
jgi:hypothetical protein